MFSYSESTKSYQAALFGEEASPQAVDNQDLDMTAEYKIIHEAAGHDLWFCEYPRCDATFWLGGKHHCRMCGSTICEAHCIANISLSTHLLPVVVDKLSNVSLPIIAVSKGDLPKMSDFKRACLVCADKAKTVPPTPEEVAARHKAKQERREKRAQEKNRQFKESHWSNDSELVEKLQALKEKKIAFNRPAAHTEDANHVNEASATPSAEERSAQPAPAAPVLAHAAGATVDEVEPMSASEEATVSGIAAASLDDASEHQQYESTNQAHFVPLAVEESIHEDEEMVVSPQEQASGPLAVSFVRSFGPDRDEDIHAPVPVFVASVTDYEERPASPAPQVLIALLAMPAVPAVSAEEAKAERLRKIAEQRALAAQRLSATRAGVDSALDAKRQRESHIGAIEQCEERRREALMSAAELALYRNMRRQQAAQVRNEATEAPSVEVTPAERQQQEEAAVIADYMAAVADEHSALAGVVSANLELSLHHQQRAARRPSETPSVDAGAVGAVGAVSAVGSVSGASAPAEVATAAIIEAEAADLLIKTWRGKVARRNYAILQARRQVMPVPRTLLRLQCWFRSLIAKKRVLLLYSRAPRMLMMEKMTVTQAQSTQQMIVHTQAALEELGTALPAARDALLTNSRAVSAYTTGVISHNPECKERCVATGLPFQQGVFGVTLINTDAFVQSMVHVDRYSALLPALRKFPAVFRKYVEAGARDASAGPWPSASAHGKSVTLSTIPIETVTVPVRDAAGESQIPANVGATPSGSIRLRTVTFRFAPFATSHAGWVSKQAHSMKGDFKHRYLVLVDGKLEYFDDSLCLQLPRGTMQCAEIITFEYGNDRLADGERTLHLSDGKQDWYFRFPRENDRSTAAEWLFKMQRAWPTVHLNGSARASREIFRKAQQFIAPAPLPVLRPISQRFSLVRNMIAAVSHLSSPSTPAKPSSLASRSASPLPTGAVLNTAGSRPVSRDLSDVEHKSEAPPRRSRHVERDSTDDEAAAGAKPPRRKSVIRSALKTIKKEIEVSTMYASGDQIHSDGAYDSAEEKEQEPVSPSRRQSIKKAATTTAKTAWKTVKSTTTTAVNYVQSELAGSSDAAQEPTDADGLSASSLDSPDGKIKRRQSFKKTAKVALKNLKTTASETAVYWQNEMQATSIYSNGDQVTFEPESVPLPSPSAAESAETAGEAERSASPGRRQSISKAAKDAWKAVKANTANTVIALQSELRRVASADGATNDTTAGVAPATAAEATDENIPASGSAEAGATVDDADDAGVSPEPVGLASGSDEEEEKEDEPAATATRRQSITKAAKTKAKSAWKAVKNTTVTAVAYVQHGPSEIPAEPAQESTPEATGEAGAGELGASNADSTDNKAKRRQSFKKTAKAALKNLQTGAADTVTYWQQEMQATSIYSNGDQLNFSADMSPGASPTAAGAADIEQWPESADEEAAERSPATKRQSISKAAKGAWKTVKTTTTTTAAFIQSELRRVASADGATNDAANYAEAAAAPTTAAEGADENAPEPEPTADTTPEPSAEPTTDAAALTAASVETDDGTAECSGAPAAKRQSITKVAKANAKNAWKTVKNTTATTAVFLQSGLHRTTSADGATNDAAAAAAAAPAATSDATDETAAVPAPTVEPSVEPTTDAAALTAASAETDDGTAERSAAPAAKRQSITKVAKANAKNAWKTVKATTATTAVFLQSGLHRTTSADDASSNNAAAAASASADETVGEAAPALVPANADAAPETVSETAPVPTPVPAPIDLATSSAESQGSAAERAAAASAANRQSIRDAAKNAWKSVKKTTTTTATLFTNNTNGLSTKGSAAESGPALLVPDAGGFGDNIDELDQEPSAVPSPKGKQHRRSLSGTAKVAWKAVKSTAASTSALLQPASPPREAASAAADETVAVEPPVEAATESAAGSVAAQLFSEREEEEKKSDGDTAAAPPTVVPAVAPIATPSPAPAVISAVAPTPAPASVAEEEDNEQDEEPSAVAGASTSQKGKKLGVPKVMKNMFKAARSSLTSLTARPAGEESPPPAPAPAPAQRAGPRRAPSKRTVIAPPPRSNSQRTAGPTALSMAMNRQPSRAQQLLLCESEDSQAGLTHDCEDIYADLDPEPEEHSSFKFSAAATPTAGPAAASPAIATRAATQYAPAPVSEPADGPVAVEAQAEDENEVGSFGRETPLAMEEPAEEPEEEPAAPKFAPVADLVEAEPNLSFDEMDEAVQVVSEPVIEISVVEEPVPQQEVLEAPVPAAVEAPSTMPVPDALPAAAETQDNEADNEADAADATAPEVSVKQGGKKKAKNNKKKKNK